MPVVRQRTVRTSSAPLAVTRIDRQKAFSTRTRSDFERGTSEQTPLTLGAASIAAERRLLTRVACHTIVRTSSAPLAVTRIDRQRAFSTRTRSNFERGTSEQTQLTPGAASIAAGVTSSAYAA